MEAEAEHDEKNGWKRYNPDAPLQETEEEAVNTLVVKRRRRVAEEV